MDPRLKSSLLAVLGSPTVKPIFWAACKLLQKDKLWLSFAKNNAERRFIATLPSPPKVLAGPFMGLSYSVIHSVGSVLAPKILGTYEAELFPIWHKWGAKRYTHILDIGCAEGFYAVGLARLWPGARVHAFDIDPIALSLCQKLAITNGVAGQVHIEGPCEPETLARFSFSGPALILSDCEGYEANLFTAETIKNLASAEIVI